MNSHILEDDHNRGPALLTVIWIFTGIAMIVVSLKIYTRVRIVKVTGLDDFLIFFSMLLVLIYTILLTVNVQHGMGRHTRFLDPHDAIFAARMNYIADPLIIMAYSIPNIFVVIFINRILNWNRWKVVLLYALAIAQNTIAAIDAILLLVQCRPSASLWDPQIKPDSCISSDILVGYSYFVGSFTAFTNIVLAIIPALALKSLHIKRKTRVAISILMSMTAVAAVCAIVKTSKLNELAVIEDFTYATIDLNITSVVEADVIIIAACVPSLRPFVRSVRDSIREVDTIKSTRGITAYNGPNWLQFSSLFVGTPRENFEEDETSGVVLVSRPPIPPDQVPVPTRDCIVRQTVLSTTVDMKQVRETIRLS